MRSGRWSRSLKCDDVGATVSQVIGKHSGEYLARAHNALEADNTRWLNVPGMTFFVLRSTATFQLPTFCEACSIARLGWPP